MYGCLIGYYYRRRRSAGVSQLYCHFAIPFCPRTLAAAIAARWFTTAQWAERCITVVWILVCVCLFLSLSFKCRLLWRAGLLLLLLPPLKKHSLLLKGNGLSVRVRRERRKLTILMYWCAGDRSRYTGERKNATIESPKCTVLFPFLLCCSPWAQSPDSFSCFSL